MQLIFLMNDMSRMIEALMNSKGSIKRHPNNFIYFIVVATEFTIEDMVYSRHESKNFCHGAVHMLQVLFRRTNSLHVMNLFKFYLVNYIIYPIRQLGLQRQVMLSHSNSVTEPLRRNTSSFTSIDFTIFTPLV